MPKKQRIIHENGIQTYNLWSETWEENNNEPVLAYIY